MSEGDASDWWWRSCEYVHRVMFIASEQTRLDAYLDAVSEGGLDPPLLALNVGKTPRNLCVGISLSGVVVIASVLIGVIASNEVITMRLPFSILRLLM